MFKEQILVLQMKVLSIDQDTDNLFKVVMLLSPSTVITQEKRIPQLLIPAFTIVCTSCAALVVLTFSNYQTTIRQSYVF